MKITEQLSLFVKIKSIVDLCVLVRHVGEVIKFKLNKSQNSSNLSNSTPLFATSADSQPSNMSTILPGSLLMTLPLWLNVVFKTNGWEEGAWSCRRQIASAKNRGAQEGWNLHHPACHSSCPALGDICLLCLHSEWI